MGGQIIKLVIAKKKGEASGKLHSYFVCLYREEIVNLNLKILKRKRLPKKVFMEIDLFLYRKKD